MKVLLINAGSYYVMQKTVIPLGLLSMATLLNENSHEVMIYDRAVQGVRIEKILNAFKPDLVGISALTFGSFKDAIKVSQKVKKYDLPVIWGGQVPSLVPEIVLSEDNVDCLVIGDGEFALLDLIEAFGSGRSLDEVEGIAYKKNGEIVYTKPRELRDLADFPLIDWSFVDPTKYFISNVSCEKVLHVYASKGCPGQCTYCYNTCFNKRKWRPRPLEHVVDEISRLVSDYGADGIYFADDLMSPNKKYLEKFCTTIKDSNLSFYWGCNMRADILSRGELKLMYDSGCRWIFFGIESGSEARQKSIKKNLNLNNAQETMVWCNEIGIVSTTSFIVGYPGETVEELKETVKYMLELASDVKVGSNYGVIPKSEMYDYLLETGKIEKPKTLKEWEKLAGMDKKGEHFSLATPLEKRVVVNRFLYMIMATKTKKTEKHSRFWFRRLVKQTLDLSVTKNLKSLVLIFISAKQFLEIMFYSQLFPGILKKYGLAGQRKK